MDRRSSKREGIVPKHLIAFICLFIIAILGSSFGLAAYFNSLQEDAMRQRAKYEQERRAFEEGLRLKDEQAKARLQEEKQAFEKAYREEQQKIVIQPPSPLQSQPSSTPSLGQPNISPPEAESTACSPTVLRGSGDTIVNVARLSDCKFASAKAYGTSNFIVWALSAAGERQELIFNVRAPYSGQKAWNPGRNPYDHIQVTAKGGWSIDVR